MYVVFRVKYPLFVSDFNKHWVLATGFYKNPQISNFVNIRPVGTELFHADGQTDMTKLIVTFRNFANAYKMYILCNLPSKLNLYLINSIITLKVKNLHHF